MVIFKRVSDLRQYLVSESQTRTQMGFVPTMGALHQGHISLIEQSKKEQDITVCSIFLNPTQFNDRSDFDKYPVSTDKDIELLLKAGCDVLFLPAVSDIYPEGTGKMPEYDFGYLDTILEGAQRPGHFKGVGQVVARLLDIVAPDTLYLGQKDYQQCMVITKLKEILQLERLKIAVVPTYREPDGLAMSSRNRRLTDANRQLASVIYQCLVSIQAKKGTDSFSKVAKESADLMTRKGFELEYISLADAATLEPLTDYDNNRQMVTLIAARIGGIRLIDNLLV
jgi:pantoate--beta-alanine ligase